MVQRVKKWYGLAGKLAQVLDKPLERPAGADDPAWCQAALDKVWVELRSQFEIIIKSSAGLVSVVSTANSAHTLIDYGALEIQVHKILRAMKAGLAAVRLAAVLDDNPGVGPSLIRRAKTMCRGIYSLLQGLDSKDLTSDQAHAELKSSVKELEVPAMQILKNAYKGESDAREAKKAAALKQIKLERYQRDQAARKEHEAKVQKAREAAELAKLNAEERKQVLADREANMAAAIEKARKEAEQRYIEEAIRNNPALQSILVPVDGGATAAAAAAGPASPPPPTTGFVTSEEGIYETGMGAREGFAVDAAAAFEQDQQAAAKRAEYISALRAEQAAAGEAAAVAAAGGGVENPYAKVKKFGGSGEGGGGGGVVVSNDAYTHVRLEKRASVQSPNGGGSVWTGGSDGEDLTDDDGSGGGDDGPYDL